VTLVQQSGSSYVFELETAKQKAALKALKPTSGDREQFHRLVLHLLWIISKPEIDDSPRPQIRIAAPGYVVPAAKVREFRRSAKSVQQMTERLAKDVEKLQQFGFSRLPFPQPPIEELKVYANTLIEQAAYDEQYIRPTPLRHRTKPQTRDIIGLVRFVEHHTGSPHWNRLSTLLQAALRDSGFNRDRLRKLVKYHELTSPKGMGSLRAAAKRAAATRSK